MNEEVDVVKNNGGVFPIKKKNKDDWFLRFIEKKGWSKYSNTLVEVKNWTITIFYAIVLATLFKTFFYENFKIPSGSMNPLLLNGDRVMINKFYYGYSKYSFPFGLAPIKERILSNRKPKRGDVVVFKTQESEKTGVFYIKRVVGLPHDKIQVKNNKLYINGNVLSYEFDEKLEQNSQFNHNYFPVEKYKENNGIVEYNILIGDVNSISGNTKEYVVPENHYFCMGDNRDNSKDSRFPDFGTIPFKNIVGKAERIFFSTANGSFNFNRIFKSIEAK